MMVSKIKNYQVSKNIDSIPVFVDSIKKESKLIRLYYFKIVYEEDLINWNIILKDKKIPYLIIGPNCIIYKPRGKKQRFDSERIIENFFDYIESEFFLVESSFIWLPIYIFKKTPKRGQVYRVNISLFKIGYQFAKSIISENIFHKYCRNNKDEIYFEENETRAFSLWQKKRIKRLRKKQDVLFTKSEQEYYNIYLKRDKYKKGGK